MIFIEYLWCFTFVSFEFLTRPKIVFYVFVPDCVPCCVPVESENMVGSVNTESKERSFKNNDCSF